MVGVARWENRDAHKDSAGRRHCFGLFVRAPSALLCDRGTMCAHPLPSRAPGSSASVARCLSLFGVLVFSFPTPPTLGVWWPNARSSGFARLAKRFAFFGWRSDSRFPGGSRASPLCPTKGLPIACDGWSGLRYQIALARLSSRY